MRGLLLASLFAVAVRAECSATLKQLTWECNDFCDNYVPCVVHDTSEGYECDDCHEDSSSDCQYECLQSSYSSGAFYYYIQYGEATLEDPGVAECEGGSNSGDQDGVGDGFPSNDDLTSIAAMYLDPKIANVSLIGGSNYAVCTSAVVQVTLAPDLLTNQSQIKTVQVSNLDLHPYETDFGSMLPSNISTLWIYNSNLSSIGVDIDSAFPNLTTVEFMYNPAETIDVTHSRLTQLNLGYNKLTEFSASLPALTELYLYSNKLKTFSVSLPSLTTLSLNYNDLTEFRATLPKLTELYLGYNKLTEFSTSLPALTVLRLDNNNLTEFNASLPALTDLRLFNNSLTEFSASLPALDELTLYNNKLTTFSASLPNLTLLYLNNNNLTEFKVSLPKLTWLYLNNNSLSDFNASLVPAVATLNLENNSFTGIPESIFNSSVYYLYLKGNPLERPALTASQADALSSIDLDITDDDLDQPLCEGDSRQIDGLTVCIIDDAVSPSSSSSTGLIVGVAVGVVVLVLLLIGAFIWSRRHGRTSKTGTSTAGSSNYTSVATPKVVAQGPLWSDAELCSLSVNPNDIDDIKKIGSGSFGVVWLVRYQHTTLLASKRLVDEPKKNDSEKHVRLEKFVSEIKLVATLEHPQIVRFVGVAWKYYDDLQVLFEYMELGDLREHLIATAASSAGNWDVQKLRLATDVIEAFVYVHTLSPPVVHRDLKSRNVLLTEKEHETRAKLTDFGTARSQSTQATMTASIGTGRWIAPEVLKGSPDYGPAADIYSFGVLLSELDTHSIPYDDMEGQAASGRKTLSNLAILQLVADGALRPSFRTDCPAMIKDLAMLCLAQEPNKRPTAAEVHYALQSIRRSIHGALV